MSRCPTERRERMFIVSTEQPTMKIDVSKEPVTIEVKQETLVTAIGRAVKEKVMLLRPGTYVVGEVKKNLYIKGVRGALEKYGVVDMVIAERTA